MDSIYSILPPKAKKHIPEREQWIDTPGLVVPVANEDVFVVMNLSIFGSQVRESGDVFETTGEGKWHFTRWVDFPE